MASTTGYLAEPGAVLVVVDLVRSEAAHILPVGGAGACQYCRACMLGQLDCHAAYCSSPSKDEDTGSRSDFQGLKALHGTGADKGQRCGSCEINAGWRLGYQAGRGDRMVGKGTGAAERNARIADHLLAHSDVVRPRVGSDNRA